MNENQNLPATMPPAEAPFARMLASGGGMNVGAVAIEQERAIAEAQGKMILARRFPRSMAEARAEFMEACADPEFAATAFYAVKNRGSGPSIRFAEEIARCYGHMDYGHRELSRTEGKSEVEVYAWDMQKNNFSRRQITVEHVLDTQDGPRKLRNQGDIDNRIANIASKQARGRILALMPKALVAAGIARCKLTISGGGEKTIAQRVTAMVEAFSKFGVTPKHLQDHLGHPTDTTTVDELADLIGIYNAIKEGAKASEYFPLGDAQAESATSTGAAITQQAKQAAAAAAPAARQARASTKQAAPAAEEASAEQNGNSAESGSKPAKDAPAANPQKSAPAEATAKAEPPAAAPAPAAAAAAPAAAADDVF